VWLQQENILFGLLKVSQASLGWHEVGGQHAGRRAASWHACGINNFVLYNNNFFMDYFYFCRN
jgi:hypothetical protein